MIRRRLAVLLVAVVGLLFARRAGAEGSPPRAVVFMSPPSEALDDSLRDALTAQLSGASAVLVFERFSMQGASLRRQVSEARSVAAAHDAVGVYWLDAQSEKDWLLYLAERSGDRVLVRRLEVEAGGTGAAVEAVSVITRQSTDALLAGQTIGMQPVDIPAEGPSAGAAPHPADASGTHAPGPSSVRARPAARRRAVALDVSYHGDSFSSRTTWQGGLRLGASYHSAIGLYIAAGYGVYGASTIRAANVAFEIQRTPLDLEMGFAFGTGRFVPALGVRGVVDLISRRGISATAPAVATPDASRAVVFLSPRVQVEYTVSPTMGIVLGGGLDLAVNSFSFVSRADGRDETLLSPRPIRPAAELGLTVRP